MFIGGGSRYLSFLVYRCRDTKTDFNLNNIIATLFLISISSVKKFAGKCPDTYSNLISTPLDGCQSWWWAWTLRATRPWRHNLCALPLVHCKTVDPYPLRQRNLRNVILQTLQLFSAYTRLYNAATSPASRLRLAVSLAIMHIQNPF